MSSLSTGMRTRCSWIAWLVSLAGLTVILDSPNSFEATTEPVPRLLHVPTSTRPLPRRCLTKKDGAPARRAVIVWALRTTSSSYAVAISLNLISWRQMPGLAPHAPMNPVTSPAILQPLRRLPQRKAVPEQHPPPLELRRAVLQKLA